MERLMQAHRLAMPASSEPDCRARLNAALLAARREAWGPDEYVGQEDYMTASQARHLARSAGAGPGVDVLELCCGAGGIALDLVEHIGCRIVGLDLETEAIRLAVAEARRRGLSERAHFLVADTYRPALREQFGTALLLETLISIEDKPALLAELRRCLRPGARLALTLEEGTPLSPAERDALPGGQAAWLTREDEFLEALSAAGFRAVDREDHTAPSASLAGRLAAALERCRQGIGMEIGSDAWRDAWVSACVWAEWLERGRARKLAFVMELSRRSDQLGVARQTALGAGPPGEPLERQLAGVAAEARRPR